MVEVESKKCGRCKIVFPSIFFGKNKSRKDGLTDHCKFCIQKFNKKVKKKHEQKIKANAQIYRDTHKEEKAIKAKEDYEFEKTIKPAKVMWRWIRNRARKTGMEFSITEKDIVIPEVCPVLGIPLFCGKGYAIPNSPSLDRIDNTKGYIPGNVVVVSYKANWAKNDCSIDELEKILNFYKRLNEERKQMKLTEKEIAQLKRLKTNYDNNPDKVGGIEQIINAITLRARIEEKFEELLSVTECQDEENRK